MDPAETFERVPIHTDADGVVRVAGTRVTLDTIVAAFDAGAAAEEIAEQAAQALSDAGFDVLLDFRDMRAGEKFADADLIGCPIRITAGKKSLEDGKVDVRDRVSGEEQRLDVADLGKGMT